MSLESVLFFLMLFMQMLNISSLIPSGLFKPLKDLFISSNRKKGTEVNQKAKCKRKHIFFKEI